MMQLHMLNVPEGVSTTHTLGKGHIDLVPGMAPGVACEPVPASLGHSPGAPGKHCLRQSPTDVRTSVEVQVSRGKVPTHHWKK